MITRAVSFLVLFSFSVPSLLGQSSAIECTVEPNHSTVGFSIGIGGLTRVTGKFTKFEIEVRYDESDPLKSAVEARIETASIDTGIDGRDEHLRRSDFFHAQKHPEIVFKSAKVARRGEGYVAIGELTMRGVSKRMELPFAITGAERRGGKLWIGISSRLRLNRNDFGVGSEFRHTAMKNFLADDVDIEIDAWLREKSE